MYECTVYSFLSSFLGCLPYLFQFPLFFIGVHKRLL